MHISKYQEERQQLDNLHGLLGRTRAIEAGLKVFNGAICPVKGHGRARMLHHSRCLDCLDTAHRIKEAAKQAGRDAALRKARAEVLREAKATAKEEARKAAQALKDAERDQRQRQRRADKLKAAREAREAANAIAPPAPSAPALAPKVPPWDDLEELDAGDWCPT